VINNYLPTIGMFVGKERPGKPFPRPKIDPALPERE